MSVFDTCQSECPQSSLNKMERRSIGMRTIFYVFFTVGMLLVSDAVRLNFVWSQEAVTVEDIVSAYEKSFATLQSWDVVYATGHVSQWDEWKPKGLKKFRWRKTGKWERIDSEKLAGEAIPRFGGASEEKADHNSNGPDGTVSPPSVEYTDGTKLWRLSGELTAENLEGIDLLHQKGLHAEIRPVERKDILLGFPYPHFLFSIIVDKRAYLLPQILRDFPTEIIKTEIKSGETLVTTRSYLVDSDTATKTKHFVQITFDSSFDYHPRQVVFPMLTAVGQPKDDTNEPFYYSVRDILDYRRADNGALFPMKINASVTDDIDKVTSLVALGKMAVLSAELNKPFEIPPIVFPPGVIVVQEEAGQFKSSIWGNDNKPLKELTTSDYEALEKVYGERNELKPARLSWSRIIMMSSGIVLIVLALAMKYMNRQKSNGPT